jgi:hypothetical protein
VHEQVVEVAALWANVLFRCEASDTFLKHENAQRINAVD